MLAGATWGKKRIGVGEDQVRLQDVDTRRMSRLKLRVGMPFQIGGGSGRGWHQEFVRYKSTSIPEKVADGI